LHDYSGHQEEIAPDQLQLLNNLASKLDEADAVVANLELELKAAEQKARTLRETDLPELMQAIGLKEITTANGLTVELREEVRASFPKDLEVRERAFSWLDENDHGGLVKHNFTISFTKAQEAAAERFAQELAARKEPVNFVRKKDLHHQTMLAFIREQLKVGSDIPLPLFGAFIQKFAKLKRK